MDLVYEQSATSKSNNQSQETLQAPAPDDQTNEINKKTEKSFEELEDGIAKTYDAIESKATSWGASFGSFVSNFKVNDYLNETRKQVENLQINDKLNLTKSTVTKKFGEIQKRVVNEENVEKSQNMWHLLSSRTNTYLDELDKELEQVETFAGSYVNKFGQFIKDSVVVAAPEDRDELIDDDEGNLLFNVTGGSNSQNKPKKLTSTRTEAQLFALHTSPELFLTNANDPVYDEFKNQFNLDSKTEDISKLLKTNSELNKLSTKIVPEKSTYEEFWTRYFYLYDKILQEETKRKKLLNKEVEPKDSKNENLQWSDDEDEHNENNENNESSYKSPKNDKSTTSSEGTYELKSVDSSTLDVTKEHNNSKKETSEKGIQKKDEEDDEDDDWE